MPDDRSPLTAEELRDWLADAALELDGPARARLRAALQPHREALRSADAKRRREMLRAEAGLLDAGGAGAAPTVESAMASAAGGRGHWWLRPLAIFFGLQFGFGAWVLAMLGSFGGCAFLLVPALLLVVAGATGRGIGGRAVGGVESVVAVVVLLSIGSCSLQFGITQLRWNVANRGPGDELIAEMVVITFGLTVLAVTVGHALRALGPSRPRAR